MVQPHHLRVFLHPFFYLKWLVLRNNGGGIPTPSQYSHSRGVFESQNIIMVLRLWNYINYWVWHSALNLHAHNQGIAANFDRLRFYYVDTTCKAPTQHTNSPGIVLPVVRWIECFSSLKLIRIRNICILSNSITRFHRRSTVMTLSLRLKNSSGVGILGRCGNTSAVIPKH